LTLIIAADDKDTFQKRFLKKMKVRGFGHDAASGQLHELLRDGDGVKYNFGMWNLMYI